MIAGQREPELTVEICAADHRQAIEIARVSFERGGVVVSVRLAEAILSDAMGVGDRDDLPSRRRKSVSKLVANRMVSARRAAT